jgi:hypothetical protein
MFYVIILKILIRIVVSYSMTISSPLSLYKLSPSSVYKWRKCGTRRDYGQFLTSSAVFTHTMSLSFPCHSPVALKANSHIQCRSHAIPMPLPCRDPAILRMWAGRPHAVSVRPMLIHTYNAVPVPFPCRVVPWPWEGTFRTAYSWHSRGTR